MNNFCEILENAKSIAVVGISRSPNKISRKIARFLSEVGYNVVGVNPESDEEILDGIEIYKSIDEIPINIDIINVFRRSEDIPEIIDAVIKKGAKVLWLQQGIRNDTAVIPVINNGITTIQDECIFVQYNYCFSQNKIKRN